MNRCPGRAGSALMDTSACSPGPGGISTTGPALPPTLKSALLPPEPVPEGSPLPQAQPCPLPEEPAPPPPAPPPPDEPLPPPEPPPPSDRVLAYSWPSWIHGFVYSPSVSGKNPCAESAGAGDVGAGATSGA